MIIFVNLVSKRELLIEASDLSISNCLIKILKLEIARPQ